MLLLVQVSDVHGKSGKVNDLSTFESPDLRDVMGYRNIITLDRKGVWNLMCYMLSGLYTVDIKIKLICFFKRDTGWANFFQYGQSGHESLRVCEKWSKHVYTMSRCVSILCPDVYLYYVQMCVLYNYIYILLLTVYGQRSAHGLPRETSDWQTAGVMGSERRRSVLRRSHRLPFLSLGNVCAWVPALCVTGKQLLLSFICHLFIYSFHLLFNQERTHQSSSWQTAAVVLHHRNETQNSKVVT